MPEQEPCILCHGAQWTYSDDGIYASRCVCLRAKEYKTYLGPVLASAPHLKSGLYLPETDETTQITVGDRTAEDLFLRARWSLAARHLKWVLIGKRMFEPRFRFAVVEDRTLLNVWLGKDKELDVTLEFLVQKVDLLILRLGLLSATNRAAASVLLQALVLRAAVCKPCWIVEGDVRFEYGHLTYNREVAGYIDEHFTSVFLADDGSVLDEPKAEETYSSQIAQPVPREAVAPVSVSADGDVSELDMDMENRLRYDPTRPIHGRPHPRPKPRRSFRGSNGGGGLPSL